MGNLRTKDLSKIGYTNDQLRSLVTGITSKHFKHYTKEQVLELLINIKNNPEQYENDQVAGKIAQKIIGRVAGPDFKSYELKETPGPCKIYGGKGIEGAAKRQMELAMHLPVSVQGALMPDDNSVSLARMVQKLATHSRLTDDDRAVLLNLPRRCDRSNPAAI